MTKRQRRQGIIENQLILIELEKISASWNLTNLWNCLTEQYITKP